MVSSNKSYFVVDHSYVLDLLENQVTVKDVQLINILILNTLHDKLQPPSSFLKKSWKNKMYTSTEQKFFGLKLIVKVVKDKENSVIKIVHIKNMFKIKREYSKNWSKVSKY